MADVLQQLQLPVGPLTQHGCRERLHDLLDGDGGVGELIFGRAGEGGRRGERALVSQGRKRERGGQAGSDTNQTRPKAPIPTYPMKESSISYSQKKEEEGGEEDDDAPTGLLRSSRGKEGDRERGRETEGVRQLPFQPFGNAGKNSQIHVSGGDLKDLEGCKIHGSRERREPEGGSEVKCGGGGEERVGWRARQREGGKSFFERKKR